MIEIYGRIAGTSYPNQDGTSRQDLIRELDIGDWLTLEREPDNEFDEWAVRIHDPRGRQLGYVTARAAEKVARHLDAGGATAVAVTEVTGGDEDKPTLGVNIIIDLLEDGDAVRTLTVEPTKSAGCSLMLVSAAALPLALWLL